MADHRRNDTRESQRNWLEMLNRQGKELDIAIDHAMNKSTQEKKL